jgi:hypothetical protein
LSKEAKLTNLGERITNVARNERNGLLIFQMGVLLFFAGVIISVVGNNNTAYFGGTFFVALGTLSTIFGFYVTVRYARQHNNLLKESDTTA